MENTQGPYTHSTLSIFNFAFEKNATSTLFDGVAIHGSENANFAAPRCHEEMTTFVVTSVSAYSADGKGDDTGIDATANTNVKNDKTKAVSFIE